MALSKNNKVSKDQDEKAESTLYFYSNDNADCLKAQSALVLRGIQFEKIKALKRNIHVPVLVADKTYSGFPDIKAYAKEYSVTMKTELRGLDYTED